MASEEEEGVEAVERCFLIASRWSLLQRFLSLRLRLLGLMPRSLLSPSPSPFEVVPSTGWRSEKALDVETFAEEVVSVWLSSAPLSLVSGVSSFFLFLVLFFLLEVFGVDVEEEEEGEVEAVDEASPPPSSEMSRSSFSDVIVGAEAEGLVDLFLAFFLPGDDLLAFLPLAPFFLFDPIAKTKRPAFRKKLRTVKQNLFVYSTFRNVFCFVRAIEMRSALRKFALLAKYLALPGQYDKYFFRSANNFPAPDHTVEHKEEQNMYKIIIIFFRS